MFITFYPRVSSAMAQQEVYFTSISSDSLNGPYYSVLAYSETVPELVKIISINAKEKPLNEVLEEVAKKANLGIVYNAGLSSLKKRVTIQLHQVTVINALERLLAETRYKATLTRMRELVFVERDPARLTSFKIIQHEITGKVTDAETGNPMPGVNIVVKNTTIGTSTNREGAYSLTVPEDADTLIFSFIGYAQKSVVIGTQTIINVQMMPQAQAFDEVVVTALGITRDERSIGYSTQQVDGENLTFSKEQNVIGSLAGKIAGVQVTGSSGASMGGTEKIKIRGVNSISGGDEPLIVVDGTPISNANFAGSAGADYGNLAQDINPADIASVNVLKGPAASALYGIRGQYGVIMITTKKGSKGAEGFTVELNSGFSIERAGNFMPFQNLYGGGSSQTWRTLPNGDKYVDMAVDESWGPRMDGTMVRKIFSFYPQDPEYGQLTPFVAHPDNIKNYFETGTNLNQGVTISGGGENSNFRLSFNDTKINGVVPNTWLKRNNVGVSAGIDVNGKLNFSTNINFATNSAQRPTQGSEYGSRYFRQWFQRNLDMDRLKDYQYDDGTILHWNLRRPGGNEMTNFSPLYWSNPYFIAHENTVNDSRDRLFGDIGVTYEVLPELALGGFIRSDTYTQNIEGRSAFGGTGTPGYSIGKYQNTETNYELLAKYITEWSGISLNATVGTNLYDRRYSYVSQATVGGLSAPGFYNIDASVDRPSTNSYLREKQVYSAYGLVSLGYRDTYFVDISLRNDKSSALPESNNSYWYPSVSGSLVFSELLAWDPLAFGKLRVSYAEAGSDLDPYETTPVYSVGTVYTGTSTLSVPNNINNPNIKPAFSKSYEAGIDLNFFGRLEVDFTYYYQRNENQIIPLDVSGTSGYSSATINAGLIENKGIEISLSGSPVQTQSLSWDATFNVNRNRNMVVELYPGIDVYGHGSTRYSSTNSYMNSYAGKSFGSLVGQAYQRDPATGKILLDQNNLPLYTDATHNFGSVLPDFNGGLQNIFRYKNFELAAMIDYQIGGQFFSRSKMLAVRTGLDPITVAINDKGNNVRVPVDEGGGVRVDGISAETGEEVTAYVDPQDYYGVTGRRIYEDWVIDASYIKLREVRLGYTFGSSMLEKWPVERVEVSLFAGNPLMIWQEAPEGLDPSELSTGGQSIGWYESGQLNTVRSYGIDLNITF